MRLGSPAMFVLLLALLSHPAHGQDSTTSPSDKAPRDSKFDFNRTIYYKNKLEFSLETGWLPNNIPFVFDFIVNSPYTMPASLYPCAQYCFSPMANRQYMGLEISPRQYGLYIQRFLHRRCKRT